MSLWNTLLDWSLDFLFPKNARVVELEKLTPEKLITLLPPAEPLKDSHTLALWSYSHPLVKEVVWELKYKGNTNIAEKLGIVLFDTIVDELRELHLSEKDEVVIMPIPISDKRRLERGWNQTELLLDAVKNQDKERMWKYLPRQLVKQHTESQTQTSSRSERLKNLSHSMRVLYPPKVEGKYVVVLDDVMTTGATFTEARRALLEAGARKMLCVAVAH